MHINRKCGSNSSVRVKLTNCYRPTVIRVAPLKRDRCDPPTEPKAHHQHSAGIRYTELTSLTLAKRCISYHQTQQLPDSLLQTDSNTSVKLGTTFDVRHSTFEIRTHQENQPTSEHHCTEIYISVQDTPAHHKTAL